jgi:hypothetical protein
LKGNDENEMKEKDLISLQLYRARLTMKPTQYLSRIKRKQQYSTVSPCSTIS